MQMDVIALRDCGRVMISICKDMLSTPTASECRLFITLEISADGIPGTFKKWSLKTSGSKGIVSVIQGCGCSLMMTVLYGA
ncbi:hypothetical protein evm_008407 [Chilo suppressalis]|nr:hypothetical protein evm_008407 [Chilo suppressalis]